MKGKILLLLLILLLPTVVYAELLEVNPLILKVSTKTNALTKDSVTVKNVGLDTVAVQITTKDASFKLSSYGFGMLPGEEKKLDFTYSSNIPGVFVNEFFIRAEDETTVLPVVVEVESVSVRFDSTVETLDAKRTFYPGGDLAFSFTVFDLFEFVTTDVDMEYYVLNMKNDLIYHDGETLNVRVQKAQVKTVPLPMDLEVGRYVLVVKSRHGGSIGCSTLLFNVVKRPLVVEELTFETFCTRLVKGCLSNGICLGIVVSIGFILSALLFIYIVEIVKLSRLPKRKIERAMKRDEKKKEKLSLAKQIKKEAEQLKKAKELEKIEEAKRKKLIEEMLLKQKNRKISISEKKLFERELKQGKKNIQRLIKEKEKELNRKKKVENMLSKK